MMFVGFNALMLMFSNPAEFGNRQHTQYKLIILPFYQMNQLASYRIYRKSGRFCATYLNALGSSKLVKEIA